MMAINKSSLTLNGELEMSIPSFSKLLLCLLLPSLLVACGGGGVGVGGGTSGNTKAASAVAPAGTLNPLLAAPTGVAVTSGNGEVALSWNPVPGATSYNVYYLTYPGVTTSNALQLTGATSGNPITGFSNTTTYYFVVTALDSAGESIASSEVSATPMPALPGIPGNVRLTGGLGEATLAWQAVPYAASYNVYYGTAPGVTTASTNNIKGITLTNQKITGLSAAPGHYYFMVTAVDASGEGAPSVELVAVAKSAYKSVAAGFGHSAALRIIEPTLAVNEGTVWTWGDNSSGQLGTNNTTSMTTAKMVPTLAAVTKISSGYHHTVGLKTDNSVMEWGLNNYGQLGDNHTTVNSLVPMHPFAPYLMTDVAGGYEHTVSLKSDGTVWSWGYNLLGQLGYASINCQNPGVFNQPLAWSCSYTPTQVVGITGSATAVAAGFQHTLAVTQDGQVWAWGRNDTGQLGNTTPNCPASIMAAVPQDIGFTGNVGFTPSTASSCSTTAVQVAAMPGTIIAVSAGTRHSVALMSDGTVWTWGGNHWGQLGYTPLLNCVITSAFQMPCSITPTRVMGLSNIVAISAGSDHTVALKGDGTVWEWGLHIASPSNLRTVLGNSVTPPAIDAVVAAFSGIVPIQTPTQVSGLSGITAIAAGSYHSLALKNNGTVWAWGYNGTGQLGNNSTTDSAVPVQVQGLLGPVVIIPGK